MASFASEKWREEGTKALLSLLGRINNSPYTDRIAGVFLCGGTSEWYYPGEYRMKNLEKGIYADFSEPFKKSISKFLKEKYGSVEELRRVWKKNDVTFKYKIKTDIE